LAPEVLGEGPQFTRELSDSATREWPDPVSSEAFQVAAARAGLELFVPVRHGHDVLGAIALGRKLTRGRFTREDFSLLSTLANQTGAAMKNASLYAESLRRAALEEELNLARQIQFTYLPSRFPRRPNLEVFGFNQPSREVGGDYFDVVESGHEFLAAIADVAGKGVPAALVMSMVQASLRTQAGEGRPVREILERINALMLRSGAEGRFATCFLARVHLDSLELSYTNAGHNPPLLWRADGKVELLDVGGLPLGAFDDPRLREARVKLHPGDRVVLYTDGVSEAMNAEGEFFGEDGLLAAMRASDPHLPAEGLARHIHAAVRDFAAGPELDDDMTLMVLKVPGPATHGPAQERRVLVAEATP